MSDVTPGRRMRWLRRVVVTVFLLFTVVLIAGFAMAPTLALWWAQPRLPWTHALTAGSVTVSTAETAVASQSEQTVRPDAQVFISPSYARDIASAASGYWIPPGVARNSQQVGGSLSLPKLRPQPFNWQVIVGSAAATPLASVVINNRELSSFLRTNGQTVIYYAEQPLMWCTYVVRGGQITDVTTPDSPALTRRLWVTAHGVIILQAGKVQREVIVRNLAGYATVTYVPHDGGYRMTITVKIEELDADEITVPVLGDVRPLLLKQLEKAANDGLIDGLEHVWLPPWTPLDTRVSVMIE